MSILVVFKFIGLVAFMLSGALVAIKKKMDLGGVIFLSAIVGLSGGTIRDLLLQTPVFWLRNNWYFYLAIFISIITFVCYPLLRKYIDHVFEKILDIFDAFGIASFMLATSMLAQDNHLPFLSSIILSLITCVGGGVLRDIVCMEIPTIFKSGLYASSVILGSASYLIIQQINQVIAIIVSCLLLISIRLFSSYFSLSLPKHSLD